ncbi:uncharacterized protein LOC141837070 [Curcuma longa]|uniref:uncharacterized protein LOC141837070 n=1 Tax=Curcuma longa TaxID=136217 RepID=UPI003D9E323D
MGCGGSKPEMGRENLPPGFFPIQRKTMEVQRRLRPGRHLSIASSTELLCSEDADGEYDLVATPSAATAEDEEGGKKLAAMEAVEEEDTVEAEEEKGKHLWRPVAEGEQLLGSPSFRFYFAGSTDDGSVILQREDTEKSKPTVDGSQQHESQPLSSTREGSDTKQRKTKAKRKSKLKALTKAPMIHILNARSYSKVAHHQAL